MHVHSERACLDIHKSSKSSIKAFPHEILLRLAIGGLGLFVNCTLYLFLSVLGHNLLGSWNGKRCERQRSRELFFLVEKPLHNKYGGERCECWSNLFQAPGLLQDRAEIISTKFAVVEKKIKIKFHFWHLLNLFKILVFSY